VEGVWAEREGELGERWVREDLLRSRVCVKGGGADQLLS
jgi:hypothetical protein